MFKWKKNYPVCVDPSYWSLAFLSYDLCEVTHYTFVLWRSNFVVKMILWLVSTTKFSPILGQQNNIIAYIHHNTICPFAASSWGNYSVLTINGVHEAIMNESGYCTCSSWGKEEDERRGGRREEGEKRKNGRRERGRVWRKVEGREGEREGGKEAER